MKYNRAKSTDWLEIDGVSDLPMRDYIIVIAGKFDDAGELLRSLITTSELHERNGTAFSLAEPEDWQRLSSRQWKWLRDTVNDAIKDEMLDPEE